MGLITDPDGFVIFISWEVVEKKIIPQNVFDRNRDMISIY